MRDYAPAMEIVLIVVGTMLAVALVAAAGGFRSRTRGTTVVRERPRRRRAPVVTEEVVERRVPD